MEYICIQKHFYLLCWILYSITWTTIDLLDSIGDMQGKSVVMSCCCVRQSSAILLNLSEYQSPQVLHQLLT